MAIVVRFVASVGDEGTGAGLRYDLSPLAVASEGTRFQIGDGYEFPRPELTRLVTGSGRPVASDYAATRKVVLPVFIGKDASAVTRSVQLTALARELQRDRNVLYVKAADAEVGRWLVTYAASPTAADELSLAGGGAVVAVVLDADPFAYGPLIGENGYNLLTADAAGFEGGTLGGWLASSGCTVINSTAFARTGSRSMRIRATGTATAVAKINRLSTPDIDFTCFPGQSFLIGGALRAAVTGRNAQLGINWFSDTGAYLSSSTVDLADVSGSWTYAAATVLAPANARQWEGYAQVFTPTANEDHHLDDEQFGPVLGWRRFDGTTAAGFGQVSSDQPASEGTAGQWYKTTTAPALGDVPAPLNLTIRTSGDFFNKALLIASRPVEYDAHNTLRFHAQDTGTTVAGTSGGTVKRHTPSGTGVRQAVGSNAPVPDIVSGAESRQLLGLWRLLYRVKASNAADIWQLEVVENLSWGKVTPTPVTLTGESGWVWFDAGVQQIPAGDERLLHGDPFGQPYPVAEHVPELFATRVSGSGTLDVDYHLAVPADGRTLWLMSPDGAQTALNDADDRIVVDGDRQAAYLVRDWAAGGRFTSPAVPIPPGGGFPEISPHELTQLFVIYDYGPHAVGITQTGIVEASYRPRYLSVV